MAIEKATVLRLPRRDYFELLERDPDFARAIILELTKPTLALTRTHKSRDAAAAKRRAPA